MLLISDRHGYDPEGDEDEEEVENVVEEEEDIDEEEIDEDGEDAGPSNKCAAAAMCVNVGGFHEPPYIGGLAHFCEHMLFMGSDKFPDENAFSAFVAKFSGSENAHTDTHCTVYTFDIRNVLLCL